MGIRRETHPARAQRARRRRAAACTSAQNGSQRIIISIRRTTGETTTTSPPPLVKKGQRARAKADGSGRSYLGKVDVEEERLLGAGHLNPVPAAGLLLLGLRVAARLHRRLVAGHCGADRWTEQSEGLLV